MATIQYTESQPRSLSKEFQNSLKMLTDHIRFPSKNVRPISMNNKMYASKGIDLFSANIKRKPDIKFNNNQDKEQLQEEVLALKIQGNNLRNQNSQLKTKLCIVEKNSQRLVRFVKNSETEENNYYGSLDLHSNQKIPTNLQQLQLLENLKQKFYTKVKENHKMEKELNQMKKEIKFTQIKELQMEVKVLSDEIARLRNMLKQEQKIANKEYNSEQNLGEKAHILQLLQADNIEMAALIKSQEQDINRLNRLYQDDEKKVKFLKQQNRISKNEITKKEKQIQQQYQEFQDKMERYPVQTSSLLNQIKEVRTELEKKSSDLIDLRQVIKKKESIIQQLEEKIVNLNNEFQEQHEKDLLEKNELLQKSQAMKNKLGMISEKMLNQSQLNSSDVSPVLREHFAFQGTINLEKIQNCSYCEQQQNKKMNRIKVYELQDVIKQMRYIIMLKQENPVEVIQALFNQAEDFLTIEEFLTIEQLFDLLKLPPFNLQDDYKCLQLARYLVESDEDSLQFDKNKAEEKQRIMIVLKKLLGPCKQFDIGNEYQMIKNIAQICSQYQVKLPGTIKSFSNRQSIDSNYFTIDSLKASFQFLDINISEQEYDYIEFQLFKQQNALKLFETNSLFEIFQLEKLLKQNPELEEFHKIEENKQKKLKNQGTLLLEVPQNQGEVEEQKTGYNFITNQQYSDHYDDDSLNESAQNSDFEN